MFNIKHRKLKQSLDNFPEIAAGYLFGSASRNEPIINDLDLLVLPYPNVDPYKLLSDLALHISESLKTDINCLDILLFDPELADPKILYHAVNEGILLINKDDDLLCEKIESLSRYFLENEWLIFHAKQLENEMTEAFCADR